MSACGEHVPNPSAGTLRIVPDLDGELECDACTSFGMEPDDRQVLFGIGTVERLVSMCKVSLTDTYYVTLIHDYQRKRTVEEAGLYYEDSAVGHDPNLRYLSQLTIGNNRHWAR